ncbi:MAG: 4'-phosphopantetheinyl transferase superfamily protein [Candidatus Gracilibacteria bacterium]|nr:4'-phosphopantetheinyl transferase superfamily protein [Candidatus Gracilibacteria bacterium]
MLKIIKITPNLIKLAKEFLPENYIKSFETKITFNESLIARYLIAKYYKILPKIDLNGKPIFKNKKFWNISHKKDLVFIGIANTNIGIDIEVIKQRGNEIFSIHKNDEYSLLGEKNLINFYILWTVKESILKLNLTGVNDLENIKINNIKSTKNIIENLKFDYEITGNFKGKDFICYNGINSEICYSISKKLF